jgi:hypothetical protein
LSLKENKVWESIRKSDKYWAGPGKKGQASRDTTFVRRLDDLRPDVLERDWDALAEGLGRY